jgi:H+/Na+-translocating ferredoxin:NAD+ oxidoreductase subunit A
MKEILLVMVSAIFINNVIFAYFLGICPYMGVSKKTSTASGMGMAVTFVMTISTAITFLLNRFILIPFHIEYLQTIMFILVIASLVQIVEIALKKLSPPLYQALGIFLPLITTNCAILGVAILSIQNDYSFITSVLFAFCSGLGFSLAIIIFSGIRERIEYSDIPECFKNIPIALITAGLLAMAFMGFSGLVK